MNKREFNAIAKLPLVDGLENHVRWDREYTNNKSKWHYAKRKLYCLGYICGKNTVPFAEVIKWLDFYNCGGVCQEKIIDGYCNGFDYTLQELMTTAFYIDKNIDQYDEFEIPAQMIHYAKDPENLVELIEVSQHAAQLRKFYEDFDNYNKNLKARKY